MRIIAGSKRGMKLLSPKSEVSRPILDRVKESLFSVLYKYDLIKDGCIADLFSGVGSLGLEAISRGAAFVAFVEKDPKVVAVLKKNIEKAGFNDKSKIIKADVFKIGAPVDFSRPKYSVVFVDPPYLLTADVGDRSLLSSLMVLLAEQLTEDGIVVVRTHKRIELLVRYGRFEIIDKRLWGTMAITILRQRADDE